MNRIEHWASQQPTSVALAVQASWAWGILIATYVRPAGAAARSADPLGDDHEEQRSARVGGFAGVLAWLVVACPVPAPARAGLHVG